MTAVYGNKENGSHDQTVRMTIRLDYSYGLQPSTAVQLQASSRDLFAGSKKAVIPAQAGIYVKASKKVWIPASTGMTPSMQEQ